MTVPMIWVTCLGLVLGGLRCEAQGTLVFDTMLGRNGDGRVTFLAGTPVGDGFTAQLYAGPLGTPVSDLQPIFPTTTFISSGPQHGYTRRVPIIYNDPPNDLYVTVVMKAYDGLTYETSACRGESLALSVSLGWGSGPVGVLYGLEPFQVDCVPEPGSGRLVLLGLVLLWGRGRRKALPDFRKRSSEKSWMTD